MTTGTSSLVVCSEGRTNQELQLCDPPQADRCLAETQWKWVAEPIPVRSDFRYLRVHLSMLAADDAWGCSNNSLYAVIIELIHLMW